VTATAASTRLNDEQLAAVEAAGEVFVSAGAGTGKTSVLVERFVRAVVDLGLDVDSVLVITYTRKAAAELRSRVRQALLERGRGDLARDLDGAWISTIHGFCNRLLKTHPFPMGLDPRFRELDDAGAAVLRGEAFERALTSFCATEEPERLRLLATYGSAGLRRMLIGVYETLRSAGRDLVLELGERFPYGERLAAFREAAELLAGDVRATPTQRQNAEQALLTASFEAPPERVADLAALRCRGERAASYEEARVVLERSALEELANADRELLQDILERFAREYADAKRRESVVDFEDLQLATRTLLRDHPEVRRAEGERFRLVMVDEFQDTNRLQCEIVDLLTAEGDVERFFVGDEFQSIYGFRHADVGVFRERREATANLLALRRNYRSRPEVLAAVNHLFGEEFGDEFQPLTASGDFPNPVFGHPVELLVTDKSTFKDTGEHWRRGEAKNIARRVRELVDLGAAAPGEIVLLFAAGTDAEWYEEELRRVGLPTYRSTGRGYFGQQQVADLLSYLRLLQNRYDDEAFASVLASPLIGVSNDALVQIRRHASRRPLFTAIERALPADLGADDVRLIRAFRQRYDRLVDLLPRVGLERLCEQVLVEHDYDLAVLARWDGRRRYANLRKLARLARSYEALRGSDIEGFARFVREQDAVGAKELEAVAEEEGADVVRLLTIHGAKGLEFKVVVVADAGRDTGGASDPDEIMALADGRFGFRVARPGGGDRAGVFDFEAVKAERARQERAERLRLYYVAMTRAIDRLIVSGAVEPGAERERETPIAWVLSRLGASELVAAETADPVEIERSDARFVLTIGRHVASAAGEAEDEAARAGDEGAGETSGLEGLVESTTGQLALFDEIPVAATSPALELSELLPIPAAPPVVPRRLSFSSIALYDRCSLRFWAERVGGMRQVRATPAARTGAGEGGLLPTEFGDAVHRLLELVDLDAPVTPATAEIARTVGLWYPQVTEVELDRIAEHVAAYCDSSFARRLAALGGARPERPFTFEVGGVLLRGRLDVLWRSGSRALVLDYKTNAIEGHDPAQVVEDEYRLQRTVYGLVCLLAGAEEAEVVYQFLERPEDVVSTVYRTDDRDALLAEVAAAVARVGEGVYQASPSAFVCEGCPILGVACAGLDLLPGEH
jgi:ATP-dependent helicase/nuclease subunit A